MTQNPAARTPTLTSLDALSPCMIKLCVADISTVLEPTTAASATATFTGFLDNATLATAVFGANTPCCGYFCDDKVVRITRKL